MASRSVLRHWLPGLVLLALTASGCTQTQANPPLSAPSSVPSSAAPPSAPPDRVTPTPTPVAPTTARPAATPTPSPTEPAEPGPMIVIDPGHSGRSISGTDAETGLRDIDYPNYPEIYEMFDVSSCVQQGLQRDGYRVELTKKRALDSVSLSKRASVANRAKAALAVSVHNDHSQTAAFQATYSQLGVNGHPMYRGSGSRRTVFRHAAVARASARYATIIAGERTKAQDRKVSVRENIFTGRAPLEPGNLALVQLLADVPWVYNEAGAKVGGSTTKAMSIEAETAYAMGLLRGIEASVPLSEGTVAQPSDGANSVRGCLVKQVEPSPGNYTRPKRYLPNGF